MWTHRGESKKIFKQPELFRPSGFVLPAARGPTMELCSI
jgi:hypothetical protein